MKNLTYAFMIMFLFAFSGLQAQVGHILQGIGTVNYTMGGAATAQPVSISGALQWNPATLTHFDQTSIEFNAGFFAPSPEISSRVTMDMGGPVTLSGTTAGEKSISFLPALGVVFGKEDSKFTWGIQAFGVSGFAVDYPEETNNPASPSFDPSTANPILFPQNMNGFGALYTQYALLQAGVSAAYKLTDNFSIGVTPIFNYATLEIKPNPTADPGLLGYSLSDKATALGVGFQVGLYYAFENGLKLGAAYKSKQTFGDFEFTNKYVDGSDAPESSFNMNFPSIISAGIGYSNDMIDLAFDYRYVDYANTEGFQESGWKIASNGFPTGAVNGFGWESISVFSLGLQYKGIEKLPLRVGYTHNTNPINEDNVFFSSSAPAIIENAIQGGLSFIVNDNLTVHGGVHMGLNAEVSGPMLNPMLITPTDPLGKIPQSEVKSAMKTTMFLVGVAYSF